MERNYANITANISLHQLIDGLEQLAAEYPIDRVAPTQINRIMRCAQVLAERLNDRAVDKEPAAKTVLDRRTNVQDRRTRWVLSSLTRRVIEPHRRKNDVHYTQLPRVKY